jgi:hypothetical protein
MQAVAHEVEVGVEVEVVTGPTYAEARMWMRWLDVLTPADLADAMAIDERVAEGFIRGAVFYGIVEDTGDRLSDQEPIYSYVPLPPGPTEHPHRQPEWRDASIGCYSDVKSPRGMPVRIVDNTKRRNEMQGTGGARIRHKQKDKMWEAKLAAVEEARAKAKERKRRLHESAGPRKKAAAFEAKRKQERLSILREQGLVA